MNDFGANFLIFILAIFAFFGLLYIIKGMHEDDMDKQCRQTYGIEAAYIVYRDRSMCIYPSEGKLQAVYKEN